MPDARDRLYFLEVPSLKLIKVGVSVNPPLRSRSFRVMLAKMGHPGAYFQHLGWMAGSYAEETAFRHKFAQFAISGFYDWFHDHDSIRDFIVQRPLEHTSIWYCKKCQCRVCSAHRGESALK